MKEEVTYIEHKPSFTHFSFQGVLGFWWLFCFFFFNLLFLPLCSGSGSSLSKGSGTTFLDFPIKGFIYSDACWELYCCGVGLFREATAHPASSQSGSWYCGVAIRESITRAASSLNLAISVLLLTTNLEGKLEHTLLLKVILLVAIYFKCRGFIWDSFLAHGERKKVFQNVFINFTFFILLRLACTISLLLGHQGI